MEGTLRGMPDSELLQLIRNDREDAFEQLYLRHTPRMYAAAISIVLSRDLAEEVIQNVMVRLWYDRANKVHGDVAGYLYRATCNEAYNLLRSEKRLQARELATGALQSSDNSEADDIKLYNAINSLPGRTGEVFRLLWTGKFSQAEVAEMLGITLAAVKDARARAIKNLRDLYFSD